MAFGSTRALIFSLLSSFLQEDLALCYESFSAFDKALAHYDELQLSLQSCINVRLATNNARDWLPDLELRAEDNLSDGLDLTHVNVAQVRQLLVDSRISWFALLKYLVSRRIRLQRKLADLNALPMASAMIADLRARFKVSRIHDFATSSEIANKWFLMASLDLLAHFQTQRDASVRVDSSEIAIAKAELCIKASDLLRRLGVQARLYSHLDENRNEVFELMLAHDLCDDSEKAASTSSQGAEVTEAALYPKPRTKPAVWCWMETRSSNEMVQSAFRSAANFDDLLKDFLTCAIENYDLVKRRRTVTMLNCQVAYLDFCRGKYGQALKRFDASRVCRTFTNECWGALECRLRQVLVACGFMLHDYPVIALNCLPLISDLAPLPMTDKEKYFSLLQAVAKRAQSLIVCSLDSLIEIISLKISLPNASSEGQLPSSNYRAKYGEQITIVLVVQCNTSFVLPCNRVVARFTEMRLDVDTSESTPHSTPLPSQRESTDDSNFIGGFVEISRVLEENLSATSPSQSFIPLLPSDESSLLTIPLEDDGAPKLAILAGEGTPAASTRSFSPDLSRGPDGDELLASDLLNRSTSVAPLSFASDAPLELRKGRNEIHLTTTTSLKNGVFNFAELAFDMHALRLSLFHDLPQCHIIVCPSDNPLQVSLHRPLPPLFPNAQFTAKLRLYSEIPLKLLTVVVQYPDGIDCGLDGSSQPVGISTISVGDVPELTEQIISIPIITRQLIPGSSVELDVQITFQSSATGEEFRSAMELPVEIFYPFDVAVDRHISSAGIYANVKLTSNLPVPTAVKAHCLRMDSVISSSALLPPVQLLSTPSSIINQETPSGDHLMTTHDTLNVVWHFTVDEPKQAVKPEKPTAGRLERAISRLALADVDDLLAVEYTCQGSLSVSFAFHESESGNDDVFQVAVPVQFTLPELWYAVRWTDHESLHFPRQASFTSPPRSSHNVTTVGQAKRFRLSINPHCYHRPDFAEASSHPMVVYELQSNERHWIVCGQTKARLASWDVLSHVDVDLIPIAAGYLPLPTVEVAVVDKHGHPHALHVSNVSVGVQLHVCPGPATPSPVSMSFVRV
eukprot:m.264660 g.264660  ORF g.264660 m.264660 type:complete len:1081 (+) comp54668_c0_seq1:954-4196(+)